jgi:1,4-dihydroxy-2-naphthoate polyprenyltransferase
VNVWIEAARPRTLTAGAVPVLVGSACAERVVLWRVGAALVVGILTQVGVNYANDYFDAVKGVDAPDRVGPRRVTAAGLVTPTRMRGAAIAAFGAAGVAGATLAAVTTPWLLLVGAAAFAAALGYSGGPRPYASAGLGEVFVFVFFGVVATVGSAYIQDEHISALALASSLPVGLLAVAILVVNNLRDLPHDARAGKRTLAVRLGDSRTRSVFVALFMLAVLTVEVLVPVVARSPWPLAAVLGVLPALPALRVVWRGAEGPRLLPALGQTALAHLATGVLLAVGLWIA